MKKTPLKRKSKTPVAKSKERIQALLREIAIERDGGCVLRHYPVAGKCGPEKENGEYILQAEHLNGRSSSISYGDMDNIVCLCLNHHFYFKKRQSALYWILIEKHIGRERWEKVSAWIQDKSAHRFYASDWVRIEEELKNQRGSY